MKIAIVGASGYAGGELIRLLVHHSAAKVICATSRTLAGTPLDQIHPHLKGFTNLKFENLTPDAIDADVAFLAVPHTAAMSIAGKLLLRGIKVVDLSADYRLTDPTVYAQWYGHIHTDPTRLGTTPYGLPELFREFSDYRLLFYGIALMGIMVYRPEGLLPSEVTRRELHTATELLEMGGADQAAPQGAQEPG